MSEIKWILEETVFAVHSRQIAVHGGDNSDIDKNFFTSELVRLQNLFTSGQYVEYYNWQFFTLLYFSKVILL